MQSFENNGEKYETVRSTNNSKAETTDESLNNQGYIVASKRKRFCNYIIDMLTMYAISYPLGYALGLVWVVLFGYPSLSHTLSYFKDGSFGEATLGYIIIFIFYLSFECIWQKTPGKMITRTRVVMKDGTKPDFKHILGRTAARFIPFDGLSFLDDRQYQDSNGILRRYTGWHDSISGTIVIDDIHRKGVLLQKNMRYCSACGHQIPVDSIFCPDCGAQIKITG